MAARAQRFGDAFIAAFGEPPYHKADAWDPLRYLVESARLAIEASGIDPRQIDGVAVSSFLMPPHNVCTVTEALGLEVGWTSHGAQGGASSVLQTMRAAEAVERGSAQAILVLSGDSFGVANHMALMDVFNPTVRDYIAPFGFGGPNGMFGLVQRRHMHVYGTRVEQLGRIAVTQRGHARLNPNALLRAEMSLDDYLGARLIADPIRLYDCVLPCGGGGGLLISNGVIAATLKQPPIRILAGAERTNHAPDAPVALTGGWSHFAAALFEAAGVRHADLDLIELYDDYPIMVAIQLEDLGFCEKGTVGRFLEQTDLSIKGELPLNTGGGQLSCGQAGAAGGMIGLVEAVRQLQGKASDWQVSDAELGLVSGYGMVGFGHGLTTGSVILRRDA